jgi:hypothetical protein
MLNEIQASGLVPVVKLPIGEASMKKLLTFVSMIILIAPLLFPASAIAAPEALVIPTFSITSVVKDTSVTIQTHNFPANDTFKVLMNYMGTRGVGGIKVDTVNSGSGGSFSATYSIPAALQGEYQIAIRLQSTTGSGYYAYNWFYNNPSGSNSGGTGTSSGYSGIPTFSIQSVVADSTVTIVTKNFPANDTFKVLMNYMGTRGVNGIQVATVDSGSGGSFTATYNIPAALKGQYQIAIRLQSTTGTGYYAYNWFYNNTAGSNTGGAPSVPSSGYTGYPTFSISSVVRNSSVTIVAYNLPPNDAFKVLMGAMGTRGVGGIKVKKVETGNGGTQTFTFAIPAELAGSYQIAIRLQSPTSGYFAYNWFYNNTAN